MNSVVASESVTFDDDFQTPDEATELTGCSLSKPSHFAQKAEGILNINGTQGGEGYYMGCNRVKVSGLGNVDGRYSNHIISNTIPAFFGGGGGDLYLNNANLLIDLNVTRFIHGHVGVAYLDEDYNPFFSQYQRHINRSFATFSQNIGLDEFFVSIRDFDRHPLFLKGGRYFLPFGDQTQEPYPLIRSLPQLLTQVRDTAIEGGFVTQDGFYASGLVAHPAEDAPKRYPYEVVFNQSAIHNFLGRAGLSKNIGEMDFNLNASFIWDIRSVQFVEDLYSPHLWTNNFQRAGGMAGHADITFGQVILGSDVVGVTRSLIPDNKQTRPIVYGITGGYVFNVLGHDSVAHLSYQRSSSASNLFVNPANLSCCAARNGNMGLTALPKWRVKADYGVEITSYMNVALEYVYDRSYPSSVFDKRLRSTHTVGARLSVSI